jgi:hypothetical protein
MIYHVLNGDCLSENFQIEGEKIICRECLIEGDLAQDLDEFWQRRENFFQKTYGESDYFQKVKAEFDKFEKITQADEVNLWFGNDVFCQLNLWFCLYLLQDTDAKIYRIFPDSSDWKCNFINPKKCFNNRKLLTEIDLQIGRGLWHSYIWNNEKYLNKLSQTQTESYLNLREVCQAIIEKETKPREILQEITENGETDFANIFAKFQTKAPIYGFGDSQVKNLLN